VEFDLYDLYDLYDLCGLYGPAPRRGLAQRPDWLLRPQHS
jgi:hypothetical protein